MGDSHEACVSKGSGTGRWREVHDAGRAGLLVAAMLLLAGVVVSKTSCRFGVPSLLLFPGFGMVDTISIGREVTAT